MNSNRRDFLKLSGLARAGLATATLTPELAIEELKKDGSPDKGKHFNMSGFAAPKLETVRIGFIGLGNRGPAAVKRMSVIEGVDIRGLCDIRSEEAEAANKSLAGTTHKPTLHTGSDTE